MPQLKTGCLTLKFWGFTALYFEAFATFRLTHSGRS